MTAARQINDNCNDQINTIILGDQTHRVEMTENKQNKQTHKKTNKKQSIKKQR